MPVEDASVTGSTTGPGDNTTLQDATVPAGETYYVDAVYLSSDGGSGSNGFINCGVGIEDSSILNTSALTVINMARGASGQIQPESISGVKLNLGAFAMAGETIRLTTTSTGSTGGCTVYWFFSMRRLI